MKTKGLKTLLIALLGVSFSFQAFTQENASGEDKGNWKDREICLRNLSMYYEFYKHKNYEEAIKPWRIVFRECPASKESLYAYGINMYRYFVEKENDPEKKAAYVDTMMMVYDQRIEYFPERKGDILGRKGIDLLRFRRQDGIEFIRQGYDILKESIEIEKTSSSPVILTTYMTAAITLFLNDEVENEVVINDYINASTILDAQLAKRPTSRTRKAKETIDENIKESKALTCEAINNIFGPKFEANKNDKDFLELITEFMIDAECEFEPLYAKSTEQLYSIEPSADAAYKLARLFFKKENYIKSKDYYLEAIERSENEEDKANYYYELGIISQQYFDQPQEAVRYAREATRLNPDWGDPYILMGSAYVAGNSAMENEFERRTVYWVAVDMFLKAKSVDPSVADKASGLVNEYSAYFPTKEDLFFRSIGIGDQYTVGGWINRTTTARAKN